MVSRRELLLSGAALAGGAVLTSGRSARAAQSGASSTSSNIRSGANHTVDVGNKTFPAGQPGSDYRPVYSPNLPTLPWSVVNGVKVFHLVAEEMWHEFAPGMKAICWGYNGHVHGPTIEAVEGDRIRVYVTNKLKAATTVHWHGFLLPNGMDGVGGLTQPVIPPGKTFMYEFTLRQHGTLMYHSHHDEMTQMSMGMMGMVVIHPREPDWALPDRDYAIMLSEWRVDNGTYRPDPNEMSDFNMLTFNAKAFPGTEPLIARSGELVRIRIGNLSAMDHHPIHLHGHSFWVTETDGGRIPESARWPEVSVLAPVGSTRTVEFVAGDAGDWAMHCHMTHHTMNQMGHDTPSMVGVEPGNLDEEIARRFPGYMTMGNTGMGEMGAMHMALPENSIAMMGGYGPFGFITMGGMFTVFKVRDFAMERGVDPGWYQHPAGTVASVASDQDMKRDGITL